MNMHNATCMSGDTNFKGSDSSDPFVYELFCALDTLLRRGFCFLKNRGKEGKAEKRERRKFSEMNITGTLPPLLLMAKS